MQRLARIKRINQKNETVEAAVNADRVHYVYEQQHNGSRGTYITFQDGFDHDGVTPIGVHSPEPINLVVRRLNRPYWIDLGIKVGGFLLSVVAIGVAIYLRGSESS